MILSLKVLVNRVVFSTVPNPGGSVPWIGEYVAKLLKQSSLNATWVLRKIWSQPSIILKHHVVQHTTSDQSIIDVGLVVLTVEVLEESKPLLQDSKQSFNNFLDRL
jgi:hypothetical protein